MQISKEPTTKPKPPSSKPDATWAMNPPIPDKVRAFVEEHKDFRVGLPEGNKGVHAIKRAVMTERAALIANITGYVMKSGRFAFPGTYTELVRFGALGSPYNQTIVMSDHHCEVADHAALVEYARAHAPLNRVLINGLGIGVAFDLLAPYVKEFVVVELTRDVIALTAPYYEDKYRGRLHVIHADALAYRPARGERFDAVFHDIWDSIAHTNLPEMKLLQRRYAKHTDWQQSWAREYCEAEGRKRKRHPEAYKNEVSMQSVMDAVNQLF